jgi:hypothetical protein
MIHVVLQRLFEPPQPITSCLWLRIRPGVEAIMIHTYLYVVR